MPHSPVTLHVLLDGEQFGDPIPALMRTPQEIAPTERVLVSIPKTGAMVIEARDADGTVITTMGGDVEEGQTIAFDPFPEPVKPTTAADVLATDAQYRMYREHLEYLTATEQLDPADDEAIERLRLRIAQDVVAGAESALLVMHRQVRGRIAERWRKQGLPWDDTKCNLWTDTPHVLCSLTPEHPGGHHG